MKLFLGAGAALLLVHGAHAGMLDKDACAALNQEMANVKALDVDKLMANGPEWAIANLSAGDLSIVRRYFELDEQIKFRCTPPSALVKLQGPADDEEAAAQKPVAANDADKDAKAESGDAAPTADSPSAPADKPKQAKPKKAAEAKPQRKPSQPAQAPAAPAATAQ
jgi:hypothetical protein